MLHINHANEIDNAVGVSLLKLRDAGFTVLNQSVLLKGINDNETVLSDLSHQLFKYQVIPYYLHQLDRVQGAAHFDVDRDIGIKLIEKMQDSLPGYLVPKLVEEISGKRSKQAIV